MAACLFFERARAHLIAHLMPAVPDPCDPDACVWQNQSRIRTISDQCTNQKHSTGRRCVMRCTALVFLVASLSAGVSCCLHENSAAQQLIQGDFGCCKEIPEYLKPYAQWAEHMRRPPKRQKRIPMESRDAYEGRPLSLKHRLRTGSVPVVEANPNLSIDDTGMHSSASLSSHALGALVSALLFASAFLICIRSPCGHCDCAYSFAIQVLLVAPLPILANTGCLMVPYGSTDAQGKPLPGVEQPSFTRSFRAADFVADPGRGEAPFSRAARDPYGGGRNLLLPLFRRLQQRSARLLSLLNLLRSVVHTASGVNTPALAAADINGAPYTSSYQESTSGQAETVFKPLRQASQSRNLQRTATQVHSRPARVERRSSVTWSARPMQWMPRAEL